MRKIVVSVLLFLLIILAGCTSRTPEEKEYINQIEEQRKEKNEYMKNDPSSPFNQDPKADFSPLKYYQVDPDFRFTSRLVKNEVRDTVLVMGTKGEERKVVKFGYIVIPFKGKEYNINVYEGKSRSGDVYHSIWFTDKTTGEETYGVGRYIDFELSDDVDYQYTIDFNLAYNPYCAYSAMFSCAIPTKEDYIDLAITAGEKNFH
jgi:uncharacterized protein